MIRTATGLALLLGLAGAMPIQAQWQLVASDAVVEMDGLPVLPGEVRADADGTTVLLPATGVLSAGDAQNTGIAGVAADRLSGEHVFIAVATPAGDGNLPGDVSRCAVDGSGCTVVFSATAEGIPNGVGISAVAVEVDAGVQHLLLSFDTSFEHTGRVYRPGDVLRYDGTTLEPALVHGELGVAGHWNITGLAFRPDTGWQLAFARGGALDGTPFFSSDVLRFDPVGSPAGFEARLRTIDLSWQHARVAGWDVLGTGRSGFAGLGPAINPGDGSVTLEVARSGGGEGRIAIDFRTLDGSATAGVDYQATSGTLVWEHGQTGSRQITVDLIDAGSATDKRDFTLELAPGSAWALTTGRDTLRLEIPDQGAVFRDSFEN